MKRLLSFLFSFALLGGGVSPVSAQSTDQSENSIQNPEQASKLWASVLQQYVNPEGRVDFRGLTQHPEDLQRYVDWVAKVDPDQHPEWFPSRDAKIAHHINAYNALAMRQVLASGLPDKLTVLRRLNFFRLSKVSVGGKQISLEDYENNVIRKLGEPRVHVALNCMSESCPRLPREAFSASELQSQLDREAHKFFNESRNVRVDAASKTVFLTEIMKFFPEDFQAAAPSLTAYANRYRVEKIPEDYRVRFIPYDWSIIHQR